MKSKLTGALVLAGLIAGVYFMTRKKWVPPEEAVPYLADIAAAERLYGLPKNLLARLLYQESHYRPDIITGETKSRVGALGIAQIVPRWHPDAQPLNPQHSIYYAAKYLSGLKKTFGNWETALAAYNWGQGNVRDAQAEHGSRIYQWLPSAPKETRDYVSEIWGDVA